MGLARNCIAREHAGGGNYCITLIGTSTPSGVALYLPWLNHWGFSGILMTELLERPTTSQGLLATLMFDPARMNAIQSFAEMMAKGVIAMPQHFRGKPADCMAILLQSMQWQMNPYAVAQKTYMDPNGKLSYESQLIYSVLVGSGALTTRPEAEYLGDWSRILGRVEEKTGSNGGKYYAPTWKKED
jgi:hypothetical protein